MTNLGTDSNNQYPIMKYRIIEMFLNSSTPKITDSR